MLRLAFFLVLWLFLARSQGDVVSLWVAAVAGHPVKAWPWLTALPLAAVGACVTRWLRRRRHSDFLGCVLVAWLFTALVSLPFAGWGHQVVLAMVTVLMIWAERRADEWWVRRHRDVTGFWPHFAPFLLRLLALCLFMGLGAAAKDTDHYELRTAQALQSGRPSRAWRIGPLSLATTPRLFALRCYVMATTPGDGGLGNNLFSQPIPRGGSELLALPTDERQRLTFPADSLARLIGAPQRQGEQALTWFKRCATAGNRVAADYYLCGLLLDRRLDEFAHAVTHYYPRETRRGSLPTYYAQALLLYTRLRTQPAVLYTDAAAAQNLSDYIAMGDTLPDRTVRRNILRSQYGETYWWWYEYAR